MPDLHLAARRAARKYGVSEHVFLRMIQQESGFQPHVKSPAGAEGIAQFIPSTAKSYGVNLHDNRVTDDLEGAARYLRDNLQRTGGNYHQALSIYNSGRPEGYKSIPETANYVRSILSGVHGASERGSGSSPSKPGSRTVSSSRTIPGVDRSQERKALILQFLQQRGRPGAVTSLATGLDANRDTPSRTVRSTRVVKGHASSASGAKVASGHSPVTRSGKIIGTPYKGTHTLGNWQSDNADDIGVPAGTPMVAVQDGVVEKVTRHPQGSGRFAGDQITIRGANGNEYFYAHGVAHVRPGQRVRKGQKLGVTGSANGVEHLHYAQRRGNPAFHAAR